MNYDQMSDAEVLDHLREMVGRDVREALEALRRRGYRIEYRNSMPYVDFAPQRAKRGWGAVLDVQPGDRRPRRIEAEVAIRVINESDV